MLNANTQDIIIINNGTLILNTVVYGAQILWAFVEAIREGSNKNKKYYYSFTILPLIGGGLAAFLVNKFIDKIPVTVTIAWAGVGVLISNLARDFFCS